MLDTSRCKLRRRAAAALARGIRGNKTLRQLNLSGVRGLDEAGATALADAVGGSKALTALNLAFVKLSSNAVDALVQVGGNGVGRVALGVWREGSLSSSAVMPWTHL